MGLADILAMIRATGGAQAPDTRPSMGVKSEEPELRGDQLALPIMQAIPMPMEPMPPGGEIGPGPGMLQRPSGVAGVPELPPDPQGLATMPGMLPNVQMGPLAPVPQGAPAATTEPPPPFNLIQQLRRLRGRRRGMGDLDMTPGGPMRM